MVRDAGCFAYSHGFSVFATVTMKRPITCLGTAEEGVEALLLTKIQRHMNEAVTEHGPSDRFASSGRANRCCGVVRLPGWIAVAPGWEVQDTKR